MVKRQITSLPLPYISQEIIPPDIISNGPPILKLDRIKLYNDKEWEKFVLEWIDSLREEYAEVIPFGGAGDMGRDVVGYVKDENGVWDNYQCKHYKNSLAPNDIWIELGKLVFYTNRGDYRYPRYYYFVAPQGAGTTLSNLLKKPDELRAGLIKNWKKHCLNAITSRQKIELDASFKAYIEGLDFSIFKAISPLSLIEGHEKTPWHAARFGYGLPPRTMPETPPITPGNQETVFVRELLNAYSDHLKHPITCVEDLAPKPDLCDHLNDSRIEFYSAESLRTFSRDTLPSGEFERLQEEIHCGIKDDIRDEHDNGYRRVRAVVKTARMLPLTGHSLHGRIMIKDRGGICHQLANDGKVQWVK